MKQNPAKRWLEHIFLLGFLVPLFFINIKTSHDWGDDFAQYIHQAKNVLEGKSQNETGYIFNGKNFIGPKAYPVGFPLLLAPIVKNAGIDFGVFSLYISAWLALLGIIMFAMLRQWFSYIVSLMAVLILIYNPWTLTIKSEVLSDIPFTAFALLCVYMMERKQNLAIAIALGVLMGFTCHIRSVGFILPIVYFVFLALKHGLQLSEFRFFGISTMAAFLCWLVITLLFPCDTSYLSALYMDNIWLGINDHLSYNLQTINVFFESLDNKNFYYIGIFASSVFISSAAFGFIYMLRSKKYSASLIYFSLYVITILVFPLGNAGYRFVLPVMPVLFLLSVTGLKQILALLFHQTKWRTLLCGSLVLYSYNDEWCKMIDNEPKVLDGPQEYSAKITLGNVNTYYEAATIVFDKPRALALFTKHQSFAFSDKQTKDEMLSQIKEFHANYLLTCNGLTPSNVMDLSHDTLVFKKLFSNERFDFYKVK